MAVAYRPLQKQFLEMDLCLTLVHRDLTTKLYFGPFWEGGGVKSDRQTKLCSHQ